jgi:hypothetical protein
MFAIDRDGKKKLLRLVDRWRELFKYENGLGNKIMGFRIYLAKALTLAYLTALDYVLEVGNVKVNRC